MMVGWDFEPGGYNGHHHHPVSRRPESKFPKEIAIWTRSVCGVMALMMERTDSILEREFFCLFVSGIHYHPQDGLDG